MGLSLSMNGEKNHILGKRYNVEYESGNGKSLTFSNILENADGKYFWFCSEDDGLCVVRQDRVIAMICARKY